VIALSIEQEVPPSTFAGNLTGAEQNACITDFPIAPHVNFLPIVISDNQVSPPTLPGLRHDFALSKQAGSLVPLGDQLDDVGQYYSQVAPSMVSGLNFASAAPITQTFALTLFADTGMVVRAFQGCSVFPSSTFSLQIAGGQLQFDDGVRKLPVEAICEAATTATIPASSLRELREEPGQRELAPRLHGIYHAELATSGQHPFTITARTASDPDQPVILYHSASQYEAISSHHALDTVHLPAVLATRDPENWWDTELIVQNVTDQAATVQFHLCDEGGHCFNNNRATLQAHERRIFLASHLLYESVAGFLAERAGWFSATVTASPLANPIGSAKVVVLTQIFKQPAAVKEVEPKAEIGSSCLLQAEATTLSQRLDYVATNSSATALRIYSPGATSNVVQVHLVDEQGRSLKTLQRTLSAGGSFVWFAHDLFSGFVPSRSSETVALQVQAEQPIVAFAWQEGHPLRAQVPSLAETVWYLPLLAAPTVEFRWDGGRDNLRTENVSSNYGLAETAPGDYGQRPLWARSLNWYTWSADQRFCTETVDDTVPYSTYVPMWWGLGGCGAGNDRSCVNTPARLARIRNEIPSSCAGRPLFLANEPDLSSPQSFMTYHELGRMIYQFRSWPGELYSPVFASYNYAAPSYVAEPLSWCEEAIKHARCPGEEECAACIQDGIVDGAVDPYDISFKGLEDYFAGEGRWVQGESWQFEDTIEGMLLHFYTVIEPLTGDSYWRAPYLLQYRDRADRAGWPIIVKEYGFVHWPDRDGVFPSLTTCDIADYVDDVRAVLQKYLGNYQSEHRFNPQKLFWFHTSCQTIGLHRANDVCLFQDAASLSTPVGICWYQDAINGGLSGDACNQPCMQVFLPVVNP
jgi:hypothetical protein